MSFRSELRRIIIRKDREHASDWDPVLELCTTGMMSCCLIIGLLGGAVGLVLMLHVANKSPTDTEPLSVGDGLGILSCFLLFSTFLPMALVFGVGKAILMKMEEDRQEQT